MKTFLLFALLSLTAFAADPPAGEILLRPDSGDFSADTTWTLSFPDAMVTADRISAGDVEWPVTITPKADARFLWTSTTEGSLEVRGGIVPGTHYRIATAPGLHDARCKAIPAKTWEFDSAPFDLKLGDEEEPRAALSTQPRFELTANYPVSMPDAAEHIFFQDRATHERFPVEVLLSAEQSAERETTLTVLPRQPLAMGHGFDLIADGLCDAFAHRPLPFLKVIPAGITKPIELQWLGAFNLPMESPLIRAKFSEHLEPATVTPDSFRVTPAVPALRVRAEEDEVIAEGTFDPHTRYAVEVTTAIKGIRGYGLAKAEQWKATFHPKEPTLIFPEEQVFQRSARGLRFSFLQVNAGPVHWRLLPVPPADLPEVADRVKGYESGEPPFAFAPAGEGDFPANDGKEEVLREIAWQPPQPLSGPYLLEVASKTPDGTAIGNRALICFSEYVLTQKRTEGEVLLRLARMSDGAAAAGVPVRAVSKDNLTMAEATTDATGLARFPLSSVFPEGQPAAELFLATTPGGLALQYAEGTTLGFRDYRESGKASALRGLLVTDRNLYRPGQTVKLHGLYRLSERAGLRLPEERQARWEVKASDGGQVLAHGEAPLTPHGSWESEWVIPPGFQTGEYEFTGRLGERTLRLGAIRVEEYRVPLFSVELTPAERPGASAEVQVASSYFHGAPNAGARVHWTATWAETATGPGEDLFIRSDSQSEHHVEEEEAEASGEAVLDDQGRLVLRCDPPFRDGRPRGRCSVAWRVDITSPEAQTFTGGALAKVQREAAWLGVSLDTREGAHPAVLVQVNALDLEDAPLPGAKARVDLYHVRARTVKERIAAHLLRYRNTREFEKVGTQEVVTPAKLEFPAAQTGEYVAVLTSPGGSLASANVSVAGSEEAELPVENETQIGVSLPEPARAWRPGEVVPVSIRAPFAGVAWVSIETDEVLDTLIVPLAGNAGRIDLPVKKEYAPNATISVYLLQPGGEQGLPRERLGQVNLEVERPDRALEVETKIAAPSVRPGAPVRGEVIVRSAGAPVAGAEFLVFAVDEAVLRLGEWKLPEARDAFYPARPHTVSTYAALTRFVEKIDPKSLHQKGYVVGGGGEGLGNVALRKEFRTLAFWQGGLLTDAQGRLHFEFPAPENLTEYRVVAIGQTDAHQFGGGSSTFKVSKPLLAEPALPRFVRIGDELMLRAVVRQSAVPKGKVTVRCTTEGMELLDDQPAVRDTTQGQPAAFGFKARVGDVSSSAKVRFTVTSDFGEQDAVEVSLPVLPPSVLRHESVATSFTGASFHPATVGSASWAKGVGTFDVTVSTSPWLPKLGGLPALLRYPHGCFEQISSRVLAYAALADLLATLPDAAEREAQYRETIESGLQRYQESISATGQLPYWPGETNTNPFATTLAAWAVKLTKQPVPPWLRERFALGLDRIVTGQQNGVEPLTRCLALMVAAGPRVPEQYGAIAQDLYLRRDTLTDEGRALLALALRDMNILPKERAQLVREFAKLPAERAFDPETFCTTTRAEAITTLALARLAPESPALKVRRERLLQEMENSGGLNTQENLWQLLAFKALVDVTAAPPLHAAGARFTSKNGASASWTRNDLARLAAFSIDSLPATVPLTALVSAEYRSTEVETERTDRGLRIERVIRNLTDPKRLGTPEAPFRLGDQLLLTYRVISRHRHYYLALEDLLPAGLETVNPDLPLIAKSYRLPADDEGHTLALSHSELRDQSTCLYFDALDPGVSKYSVLARATTAGAFRWPAAQIYPMYDSRFTGLSAAGVCVVKE